VTGTLAFLRLHLRRDRWMLLWWAGGTTLLYVSQAISVDGLYATRAELKQAAVAEAGNAAFVAMAGPARALDTVGGQTFWQASASGAAVVGLMSMFLVGRHTRAEEESGRDELLRAAAVGRFASTSAALGAGLLANLLLGVLVAAALAVYGLAVPDSVATGLGLTLCGWFFTGTALVAAQLTASTRAAYGLAGVVIALSFVLRAIGDVGNGVASWLSPIGWYQAMHPYSGLRWWPALFLLVGAAAATSAAYALFARRDFGSGIVAARPGPASAGETLRNGAGLAWRLHRGALLGWAAGLLLLGLAYGAIGNDVGDLLGDSDASREMFAQRSTDIVDGFYATAMLLLALIASGHAISSALRPRGEEESGHLEVLLASALPRHRWLLGHVAMTVAGVVVVLAGAGLGLGGGFVLATGDGGAFLRLSVPLLQYAAPVLVLSGVARLLYGVAPRALVLAWAPLVLAAVVLLFGEVLRLPQWLRDLSPFEHLAHVPAEEFRWAQFLAVAGVAAVLSVAGQIAFRRRDVH
jgi:ABC-2 type transport system permease protein